MTICIRVIGIGAGNPDHITVQGINALNSCDVIFVPSKNEEKQFLAQARVEICGRYITEKKPRFVCVEIPVRRADEDYRRSVHDWHAAVAAVYEGALLDGIGENETVGLLIWGDPMLFDSTLRIIELILSRGRVRLNYDVIPGITSLQALCAAHRISLNAIGKPVEITTGRWLSKGWPTGVDDVAVILDGRSTYETITDETATIHWGAYLGTAMEITIAGPLSKVGPRITEARMNARAEHGWIMDAYILRRNTSAVYK
jgi:precorrin-6A synthase